MICQCWNLTRPGRHSVGIVLESWFFSIKYNWLFLKGESTWKERRSLHIWVPKGDLTMTTLFILALPFIFFVLHSCVAQCVTYLFHLHEGASRRSDQIELNLSLSPLPPSALSSDWEESMAKSGSHLSVVMDTQAFVCSKLRPLWAV